MSKVAIFTNSIYTMGGEQRVVCVMANEFVKKHDVTVITMDSLSQKENLYGLLPEVKVKRYLPYRMDIVSFILRAMTHLTPVVIYDWFPKTLERAYCNDHYAEKMREIIEYNNYDTVIATAWQLSILLGKVCKTSKYKFKSIGWEHNSYEAYFQIPYFYLYKNENLFVENARKLSQIVVLNEDYQEKYKLKLGLESSVIYNPKSFISKEKTQRTNKQFVACGRLHKSKGFDLLLEAFALFCQDDQEWMLKIAGTGRDEKKLKRKAERLGIADRVIFLGHVKNMRLLLLETSIFLLTSRYEGFPMCITEAFEIGLPVIAFDIPAMIPFKKSGAVVTVDCFEVGKYKEAMCKLSSSVELRNDMSEKAISFARKLSVEEIAKKWEI